MLPVTKLNKKELEKILNHYEKDVLKQKAAIFLLENMSYHFSQEEYFISPTGSSDLSVPSRILKFNWNGKHINTFLLDRPIQQFAVNEKKKCIIAISSYNTEGQDIIEYKLE